MKFNSVKSDTLSVEDGEWSQIAAMLGDGGIRAKRIVVETEAGTIELSADYGMDHGCDVVVSEAEGSNKTNKSEQ